MAKRIIQVLSTSRSDYGHLLPICKAIQADPDLELRLVQPLIGSLTEGLARNDNARADGFDPQLRSELSKPADFILFLGDRIELLEELAPLVASNTPFVQVHAGEETQGSTDNRVRHALTKLSHLHVVAHEEYAERVLQMGEEPWRVHVVGAPCLDLLEPYPRKEYEERCHIMAVFQLATLESGSICAQLGALQDALGQFDEAKVIVGPNADLGGGEIDRMWREWCTATGSRYYQNIPPKQFWGLMASAKVLVGNSSAGMIEASTFGLPVVNTGTRQDGRICPQNVQTVGYGGDAIRAAIAYALHPNIFKECMSISNPLWRGGAASKIVSILKTVELGNKLLRKRWVWR